MKTEEHDAIVFSSDGEKDAQSELTRLLKATPIPDDELLANLGMFLTSKNLARLLFFFEMYKKVVSTHGVIMEFGTRWGQTVSLLAALRGIFEPFNRHRKIIGFDTFEGLRGFSAKDGADNQCADGSYSVSTGYEHYLEELLTLQEALNPASHIKKSEVIKGDVTETLPAYLKAHPETLVSLAVFDLDIFGPTKAALQAIKPLLFKGSVLVFDELGDDLFPGETTALLEVLELRSLRLQRLPMTARLSYVVLS